MAAFKKKPGLVCGIGRVIHRPAGDYAKTTKSRLQNAVPLHNADGNHQAEYRSDLRPRHQSLIAAKSNLGTKPQNKEPCQHRFKSQNMNQESGQLETSKCCQFCSLRSLLRMCFEHTDKNLRQFGVFDRPLLMHSAPKIKQGNSSAHAGSTDWLPGTNL